MRLLVFIMALFITGPVLAEGFQAVSSYIVTGVTGSGSEATDIKVSPIIGGLPHNSQPVELRLICTKACFVAVSHAFTTAPTSTPVYIPDDTAITLKARQGDSIIVVQSAATGTLFITEISR